MNEQERIELFDDLGEKIAKKGRQIAKDFIEKEDSLENHMINYGALKLMVKGYDISLPKYSTALANIILEAIELEGEIKTTRKVRA